MSKEMPSRNSSTSSIVSFVCGAVQIILTCIIIAVVINILDTSKTVFLCVGPEECANLRDSVKPNPPHASPSTMAEKWITGNEMIYLLTSNLLALIGIFTGIAGWVEASKTKKDGALLAQFGLAASVLCITITAIILWNINLQL